MQEKLRGLIMLLSMLVLLAPTLAAANALPWKQWLTNDEVDRASNACRIATESKDVLLRAEGFKCLANIAIRRGDVVAVRGNGKGGGTIGPGYSQKAAAEAVVYLNRGIDASPQDLSIHQGRMHILLYAQMYDEMIDALKDSLVRYKSADKANPWLAYSAELFNMQLYSEAIRVLNECVRVHPDDHRLYGNLAGMYAMLEQDDKAFEYGRKAVQMAPKDPVNAWNLARSLDYAKNYEEADVYYARSLVLENEKGQVNKMRQCAYAEFLRERKNDMQKLCSPAYRGCVKYEHLCR